MSRTVTRFFAYFLALWLVVWCVFRFFTPLWIQVRHTYQLPAPNCTNRLTSDLWTFEAVREGLVVLYLLVPASLVLLLWAKERFAWGTHLFMLIVFICWSAVMMGFDIRDWVHANVSPADANFRGENLARDPQYCLYYGGQPGTELLCGIVAPCSGATSAVDPASFQPNVPFTLRFAFNIFLLGMMIVNLWVAVAWRAILAPQPETAAAPLMKEEVSMPVRYSRLK